MDQRLLQRMQELRDLGGVIGLATWDQETYLPRKAEGARASQLATLQGLYHERLVEPALGDWLASAKGLVGDEQAMVRVLTHERDRAVKVPARLVKELAEAQSHAIGAWKKARAQNDFAPFKPHLERLLALRREQADAMGHGGDRYDALLDNYEPGMKVARLTPVLQQLRAKLTPIVQTICDAPPPRDVFAGKSFDVEAQWRFTVELLGAMGFDLEAGRQDKSVHPFTGGTHPRDVRLTTRLQVENPLPALFGTIHEGGHGLYEQGFAEEHFRTPIA
ncbi:MAG: carboxypeptidase M32, partial [Myxococcaceae bacterium]|nr:carboxypeptidase M32 [Myxococcaceae bacterium]